MAGSGVTQGLSLGAIVEHTSWGAGKVVETIGPHLVIHFPSLSGSPGGPRRKIQATSTHLRLASEQSHPELDHVEVGPPGKSKGAKGTKSAPAPTLHTLDQSVSWFQVEYPGLFQDPKLVERELAYKRAAHIRWQMLFGDGRGKRLIEKGDVSEIGSDLDTLHHATNIPSRFEIMAAHDGYKDPKAATAVLSATLAFLEQPDAATFDAMVSAVSSLPAPADGSRVLTWPNVTILPFLAEPTRFMVVKPQITRKMARRMNFDILYSPQVTWHCYDRVLQMSEALLERLDGLGARDYIDVQSFMWVTQDLQ